MSPDNSLSNRLWCGGAGGGVQSNLPSNALLVRVALGEEQLPGLPVQCSLLCTRLIPGIALTSSSSLWPQAQSWGQAWKPPLPVVSAFGP